VDLRPRVEAALDEVVALCGDGLITLERARMADAAAAPDVHEETKLSVYLGRGERAGGRPAHMAVVDALHRHGVAGATVLLGVDGTAAGERRRARFFAANAQVPLMVVAVGAGDRIAAALPDLRALPAEPLITLERVRACKRAGQRLAGPERVAASDRRGWRSGRSSWSTAAAVAPRAAPAAPRARALAARASASGATALRGTWGYLATTRPTATASGSCAGACPSSR
jgi:PII-like signaling protein